MAKNTDQIAKAVFDVATSALKTTAAAGPPASTPTNTDQIFFAVYDEATGALRVTGSGGGGGAPGAPPLSLQASSADGTEFIAVPNSDVDPTSGGVTLGGPFSVNATGLAQSVSLVSDDNAGGGLVQIVSGNQIAINVGGTVGLHIDTTNDGSGNPGNGPTTLISAGSIVLTDTSTPAGVFTFNGNQVLAARVGTTPAIGGVTPLTLGQQATVDVTIAGSSAAVAAGAVITVTPVTQSAPGDGFLWTANLTGTDTITVKVLCLVAGTPVSTAYNVKVF